MKKTLFYVLMIFTVSVIVNNTAFSANERFRSIASGNWNATLTWELSTNNGTTWIAATSTPTDTSGLITIRTPNTVSVSANVSADQLTIDNGGTLSINAAVIFTLLDGAGNDLTLSSGGTVTGNGTFQSQGVTTVINLRTGSIFNAAFKVISGTTTATDFSPPYTGKFFGNVTVDAGATLSSGLSTAYSLWVYGNLTNNGTITGSGSTNQFFGSALVNNGSITSSVFEFDSTSTVSGAGTFTGAVIVVTAHGNVSLLNNVTYSLTTYLEVQAGGIFSANTFTLTFTSGIFRVLSGGTVANSGTVKTQNTVNMNLRTGSAFNANLIVNTGTTTATELSPPYNGKIFGNVTVDNGATLSSGLSSAYSLWVYGNLTNNGTITGSGATNKYYGPALVNNGSITSPVFTIDSTSTYSGTGTFTGAILRVTAHGNVSLLNSLSFSVTNYFEVQAGGKFSANSFILTFTSGTFLVQSGGTVVNSGTIRTQNTVTMNLITGSAFNANLIVNTGTTTATEYSPPYNGKLFGNVTVDAGATLSSGLSSAYSLWIYGNLTNNGSITGSGATNKFYGPALVNNGSITSPVFEFDSTSTVSGSGTYTGAIVKIDTNNSVTLLNNITMGVTNYFLVQPGAVFSPNTFTLTFTSGTFEIANGATVSAPGTVKAQNTFTLNVRTGSLFNANLNVNTGTTSASDFSPPYNGKLFGNVTVDAGAILTSGGSSAYSLAFNANVTNNGTITGTGQKIFPSGVHTITGSSGKWTASTVYLLSGAVVNLTSTHQMADINIAAGASFDISTQTLKFTSSNPIIQNGTFTTTGSKIEYSGTTLQSVSVTNIIYYGLRINNAAGATLLGNITIPDTLSVILGDLNLNGKIITLTPTAYMTETPGNTVFGVTGYITTTRNISSPSSLNVAGMGAVLTQASKDLGSTEIRRGHTVQTGLNGGTSIKRYYDITPTNNTGLNATLVFKFDDSELNGKPEPSLKLFKSTNTGSTWLYMGGTVDIAASQITLNGISSFSRWSADSSKVSAAIAMIMEGFYNVATNNLNMTDTVRAYLRNTTSPYAIVDSAKGLLDSLTFRSAFQFSNATSGTYYIQLKHRNSLETWSKTGVNYIQDSTLNYDFTFAATQAYGKNEVLKVTKFCLYSGDVTQDGFIDLNDVLAIDLSSRNFTTGYVAADVNGNSIVDLTDELIAYNNSILFVKKKTPLTP